MAAVMTVYLWGIWRVGPDVVGNGGLSLFHLALFSCAAFYAAVVSPLVIHRDPGPPRGLGSWRTLFLRTDNLRPALRAYGAITLTVLCLIAAAGLATGRFQPAVFDWDALARRVFLYVFSALGQQYFLFGFFYPRIQDVVCGSRMARGGEEAALNGSGRICCRGSVSGMAGSALGLGVVAAVFHYPNVPLMWGILLAATAWSYLYERIPSIWVSACCHALIGSALNLVLLIDIRIGPSYGTSYKGFFRTVFPFLNEFIGGKF
jgi:hypothetical protein